jgi:hypothetical protein
MYDNLIKHQAEEIGRLRALVENAAAAPVATDEINRLRNELVKLIRDLEAHQEFLRRLPVHKRARELIEEFLSSCHRVVTRY